MAARDDSGAIWFEVRAETGSTKIGPKSATGVSVAASTRDSGRGFGSQRPAHDARPRATTLIR